MTNLFDRFDLGGLTLPNRMVMAPMTRPRDDENGRPMAPMREYYVQRAAAGRIVTERTAKAVAETLGVARSHLHERFRQDRKPRDATERRTMMSCFPSSAASSMSGRAMAIVASPRWPTESRQRPGTRWSTTSVSFG